MPLHLFDNWRAPAPDPARTVWLDGWEYAHRGLHGVGVVENSPSAFKLALKAGIGIECDIQRSRDGGAMVFHDWELGRLTGENGKVIAWDAADLMKIRLVGGEDTIPPLVEVLDLIAGQVPLLIEIKSHEDDRAAPACRSVRRALEGYQGRHAVMSFDPRVSRWFARNSPQTVRGLVVSEQDAKGLRGRYRRRQALWHAQPDFLAYDIRDLPSRFADQQRKRGFPVLTWTVRDMAQRKTAENHADALIAEGEGLP